MRTFKFYLLNLFHLSSDYCFSKLLTLDEGERLNGVSPDNHYRVSSWTWLSGMFAIKGVDFLYVSIYDPAKVWIYKSSMWGYIFKLATCKSVFCILLLLLLMLAETSLETNGSCWFCLFRKELTQSIDVWMGQTSFQRCFKISWHFLV